MFDIGAFFSSLVSPISKAYQSRQERKAAKESAESKIKLAKQTGDFKLDLTDAEWEALSKRTEGDSWKDEWVTVIITLPIPLIFISAILSAYTDNPAYISSIKAGVNALIQLIPNYRTILEIVVLAAVSIKSISVLKR
ncbi:hypothetical protein J7384_17035 [Endozoicomonas sp. G2_1]|uniref:hypothetical protein n=1 Tax=Endozoicomonas sp. G2_1 TaxID=2821091 RepID=UPI001ADAD0DA|nr:hypothetical protein [Endozoicomonas sp. G2_1]MBO9492069.1 hypothetical protein [Endozoicomonas sp. G2_1]